MIIYPKTEKPRLCFGLMSYEFDCKCKHPSCRVTLISPALLEAYQKLRKLTGQPLVITCGYRCPLHNFETKDSYILSRHQTGEAIDIADHMLLKVFGTPERVSEVAESFGFTFVLHYTDKRFFHFNV